jgi:hypothetical protein
MAAMAMMVNRAAEMRPMRSPKLRRPTARPPRMTVKFSHERKVRSLAKKTFGSTRVGRAMRLPKRGVSRLVLVELGATKTIMRTGMKW